MRSKVNPELVQWVTDQLENCEIRDFYDFLYRGVGQADEPFDGNIWPNEHDMLEGLTGSCWSIHRSSAEMFGTSLLTCEAMGKMLCLTPDLYSVWAAAGPSGYGDTPQWEIAESLWLDDGNVDYIGKEVQEYCLSRGINLIQLYEPTHKDRAEDEIFIVFNDEFPFEWTDIT